MMPDHASLTTLFTSGARGARHRRPGLRPIDHPDYYAAFLFYRIGHQIEAVHHKALKKKD